MNKITTKTKVCFRCKKRKNRDEFSPSIYRRDGLNTYCRKCNSEKQKAYNKKSKKLVIGLKTYDEILALRSLAEAELIRLQGELERIQRLLEKTSKAS